MPNVSLGPYNTLALAASSGVYRLKWPGGLIGSFGPIPDDRILDVMNIGGGAIFLRADKDDPAVNDPNSLQLPANWAVNALRVDGGTGLGVIAASNTTITVRMTEITE